jgi:transmembrane sensor
MSYQDALIEEAETRAAEWILRRDRGGFTPQDRMQLEAWLSADSHHRDAYRRLDEAWRASAGLRAWRPVDGRICGDVLASPSRSATRKSGTGRYAVVASVVLLCALLAFLENRLLGTPTYSTRVGGYQRVPLEDGSVVQLNTDTLLRVNLSKSRRVVRLERGEAYFEVAHDANRPFDVVTADTTVRAVGTQFDVHRTNRGTEVTVTQGSVRVTTNDVLVPTPLAAGESAQAQPDHLAVARVEAVELSRRLAWRVGELHFKNQPLAQVVAEFNRYNHRQLEIADAALGAVPVGGTFKVNDVESFVAALRGSLPIRVEQDEERIRIFTVSPH